MKRGIMAAAVAVAIGAPVVGNTLDLYVNGQKMQGVTVNRSTTLPDRIALNISGANLTVQSSEECTDDADCDDVLDSVDNCPTVYNPGQQNTDENFEGGDALGDACDADDDADGFNDVDDDFPLDPTRHEDEDTPPSEGPCQDSATVECSYNISLAEWNAGDRLVTDITVPGGSKTLVSTFTTGSQTNIIGKFGFIHISGQDYALTDVWISTEPGGPGLSHFRCSTEGAGDYNLSFTTRDDFSNACQLELNSTYFLNVRHRIATQSSNRITRQTDF